MATYPSAIAKLQAALAEVQAAAVAPPPPLWSLEMIDAATIAAAAGPGKMSLPWAFGPVFGVEPTGAKYLQVGTDPDMTKNGPGDRSRLIAWFMPIGSQQEAAWFNQVINIGTDVATGFNPAESGVKLPGPSNEQNAAQGETLSCRLEHTKPDPQNPGVYHLVSQFYDEDQRNTPTHAAAVVRNGGYADTLPLGATLYAGQDHYISFYVKLNTPGVADGIGEIWVDGVMTWRVTNKKWRSLATTKLQTFYVNIYHGGLENPIAPMTYRISHYSVTLTRPDRPADLKPIQAPPQSWLLGRTKDVFAPIMNTNLMNGQALLGNTSPIPGAEHTLDAWCGVALIGTSLWAVGNAGHANTPPGTRGWENKALEFPLADNVPQWWLRHPGSKAADTVWYAPQYLDGRFVGRHTYYSAQGVGSKVMLFDCRAAYGDALPPGPNGEPPFQAGPLVDSYDTAVTDATIDPAAFPMLNAQFKGKHEARGLYPNLPLPGTRIAKSTCKDPSTEDVYVAADQWMYKWTKATNAWSLVIGNGDWRLDSWEFGPSVFDGTRKRIVHCTGNKVQWIDPVTKTLGKITPLKDATGANSPINLSSSDGMVLDTKNDRLLAIESVSGKYWAIDPVTFVVTPLGATTPSVNGVHTRMQYVGGAIQGVVYLPSYGSNAMFAPV